MKLKENIKKGSALVLALLFTSFGALITGTILNFSSQQTVLIEKQIAKTQDQYLAEGALEFRKKVRTTALNAKDATGELIAEDLFSATSQTRIDNAISAACVKSESSKFNFSVAFNSTREKHDDEAWMRDADAEKLTKYKYLITRQAVVKLGNKVNAFRRDLYAVSGYKEWVSQIPLFSLLAFGKSLEIVKYNNEFTLKGRIHSNGNIYLGSGNNINSPLIFQHRATNTTGTGSEITGEVALSTVGDIYRRSQSGYNYEFYKVDNELDAIQFHGFEEAAFNSITNDNGVIANIAPLQKISLNIDNTNGDSEKKRIVAGDGIYNLIEADLNTKFDDVLDAMDSDNRLHSIPLYGTPERLIQNIQYYNTYDLGTSYKTGGVSRDLSLADNSYIQIRDGVFYFNRGGNEIKNPIGTTSAVCSNKRLTEGWYPSKCHPNRKKYNDLRWYGWYGMRAGNSRPSPGNPARWHFPVRSVSFIDSNENPNDAVYGDRDAYTSSFSGGVPSPPVPNITFTGYFTAGVSSNFRDPERQAFSTLLTPEYCSNYKNPSADTLLAKNNNNHFIDTKRMLHNVYREITSNDYSDKTYPYTGPNPTDGFGGVAKAWPREAFHSEKSGANPKSDILRAQYVELKNTIRRMHNAHHIYTSQVGLVMWLESTETNTTINPCVTCSGTGMIDHDSDPLTPKIPCATCSGTGTVSVTTTTPVGKWLYWDNPLPAGWDNTKAFYATLNIDGTVPDYYVPHIASSNPADWPTSALPIGSQTWHTTGKNEFPDIWGGNNAPNYDNYSPIPIDYIDDEGDNTPEIYNDSVGNFSSASVNFSYFWDDDKDASTPKVELFPYHHPTVKNDEDLDGNASNDRKMYNFGIYKSTLPLSDRTIPMPYGTSNAVPLATDLKYGTGYLESLTHNIVNPLAGASPLNRPAWFFRQNNYPESLRRMTSGVANEGNPIPYHVDQFWYNGSHTGGYYGNDNLCMFNEREGKFVVFTEIDMRELTHESFRFYNIDEGYVRYGIYAVNSTLGKNIYGKVVPCGAVRIKRGRNFWSAYSLASANPVYVWGDLNWPNFKHEVNVSGGLSLSYNVPIGAYWNISNDAYWSYWDNLHHVGIYADSIDVLPNTWFPGSVNANILQNTLRDGNGTSPFPGSNIPNAGILQLSPNALFDSQFWWEDDGVRVLGGGGHGGGTFVKNSNGILEDYINYTRLKFEDSSNSASLKFHPVITTNATDNRGYQTPILCFASQGLRAGFYSGNVTSQSPIYFSQGDITSLTDPVTGSAAPLKPASLSNFEWYLNWVPISGRYTDQEALLDAIYDNGSFNGKFVSPDHSLFIDDYYSMDFKNFYSQNADKGTFENFKNYFSGGGLGHTFRFHKPYYAGDVISMNLHLKGSIVSLFDSFQDNSFLNAFLLSSAAPNLYFESWRDLNPRSALIATFQEEGEFFALKGSKYRGDSNVFDPTETGTWW